MPAYRLTASFNYLGPTSPGPTVRAPSTGFRESWEFLSSSDAAAQNVIAVYQKDRQLILASNWAITEYRITRLLPGFSKVDVTKCILKQTMVQLTICPAPIPGSEAEADTPWAAVLLKFPFKVPADPAKAANKPKQFQLRGVPDSWWVGGGLAIPGPATNHITDFMSTLVNGIGVGQHKPNAGCSALAFKAYSVGCIVRMSNRRIGRPSGLLSGRKRKKKVVAP